MSIAGTSELRSGSEVVCALGIGGGLRRGLAPVEHGSLAGVVIG